MPPGERPDYRTLANFRQALRRFLAFSEAAARDAGLTPQQHQALLAIAGHEGGAAPGVGELAASLLLRHNSAVELVDRLEDAGLVERRPDPADGRRVRVALTPRAETLLEALSATHLEELRRMHPALRALLETLERGVQDVRL